MYKRQKISNWSFAIGLKSKNKLQTGYSYIKMIVYGTNYVLLKGCMMVMIVKMTTVA